MEKPIKPGRITALAVLLAALLVIFVVALYKLQIVEGSAYYEESRNSVAAAQRVEAARGSILDRYGRLLVSNISCNNIIFDTDELFDQEDPNAVILQMVRTVQASGGAYNDELPVTQTTPFAYTEMSDQQQRLLQAYLKYVKLDEDASAVELMSAFREQFKIDNNYSAEEMRIIAGVRYSIKIRYVIATSDYVFVPDASMELISTLMESGVPGFDVTVSYMRQYNTSLAAHLIGYTRSIGPEDYEIYKPLGYPLDAQVGKVGAEYAFEKYLHGKDGKAIVTKNASGAVTGTIYTTEPEPGANVSLTIDLDLQGAAEKALANGIESMQAARDAKGEGGDNAVGGGAIAAVNVKTGEPLALANYPTYDLATAFETDHYTALSEDKSKPLFNRVLEGLYEPGSTFKPCTAIAGLSEGVINTGSTITCEGIFKKYEEQGYAPRCWIYSSGLTHGADNVTEAIRDSCNIFFYTVGDSLKIETLDRYAAAFGLGESTGIELPEKTGQVASPESKKKFEGVDWYVGDSLQAAIGQSYSQFTPLQLAEYCATIANGGTRHSASLLKAVRSYDDSELLYEREPEVLSTVESSAYNWTAVQQGMYLVANDPSGSAYETFGAYGVKVAAKTGTAQRGENQVNNAIFICYAPYDNPEIAVAVVVEKGNAGSSIASIARDVLDAYFTVKNVNSAAEKELSLLP